MTTVLITGASEGIGKATALLLAQQGYDLVLAARNSDSLAEVAQAIEAMGRKALAVPTDVANEDQVNRLVTNALDYFNAIDVLVNNAGICMVSSMAETTLADWQKVINVNLWGYIYTITALLPHFLERQQGKIINVGSIGGKVPLPHMTVYCTSKYAITGLTESLRVELEPKGIDVCGVYPSVTKSDFLKRTTFRGGEDFDDHKQHQQMAKMLNSPLSSSSEDVAKVIWKMIKNPQAEVIVGSGKVPTAVHNIAPGLTRWMMSQMTQNRS